MSFSTKLQKNHLDLPFHPNLFNLYANVLKLWEKKNKPQEICSYYVFLFFHEK